MAHKNSGYRVPGVDLELHRAFSAKNASRTGSTLDVPTEDERLILR